MRSKASARVDPVVADAPPPGAARLADEGRFLAVKAFFPVTAVFVAVGGVRRFRDFPLEGSDPAKEGRGEDFAVPPGRLGGGDDGAAKGPTQGHQLR